MTRDELRGFLIAITLFGIVQYFLGTFEWEVFVATCVIVFSITVIYRIFKPVDNE